MVRDIKYTSLNDIKKVQRDNEIGVLQEEPPEKVVLVLPAYHTHSTLKWTYDDLPHHMTRSYWSMTAARTRLSRLRKIWD